ncbi:MULTISPECIES: hypothetical protein [Rhodococcus]|uniref:hypothetical protein n=1 Tax=Rhodococcus TaxID=1827 RepID=UPI0002F43167|nr:MULTISPECIES: hypothetical protein [Rhodococcus]NHU46907.1 hypothetical protein [Rhodococcus sp. A14]MBA8963869.1 hypothetical protein [Rhodococcus opacus]MBP2207361.1 hypothetical protein [Rhodococcus opacus]MDI9938618.1 hypothetical protein [Rhodococcus sp. IEGM 1351]MDJ0418605.1 hypothetical protein [Rhodococcus opacus]
MRRVVRAFWGPRREPVETLAGQWRQTLEHVTELLPAAAPPARGEWRQVHASGPDTACAPDELTAVLLDAQGAEAWSDLTGTGLRLMHAGADGWAVELSGVAGGAPQFLLQSLVMTVDAPDGAVVPESELLATLASVWEPDFGDVSDDDILDALEDDAGFTVGDPVVGRFGYLSAARAVLVPDGPEAVRQDTLSSGRLLHIAAPGDVDTVVRVYGRLRDAGALDPLRRPLDRPTL